MIFNEVDEGGRAMVTRDKERVQQVAERRSRQVEQYRVDFF